MHQKHQTKSFLFFDQCEYRYHFVHRPAAKLIFENFKVLMCHDYKGKSAHILPSSQPMAYFMGPST